MEQNPLELTIAERRDVILGRIGSAAKWAGRDLEDITFVAVSKQQEDDRIQDALSAGHKVFGENRVQEAQQRWSQRFTDHRENIELRLIGPLQSNKALDAVKLFDVIETLDRLKLAGAIVRAADKAGRMPRLFVQVNIGAEPQKSGIIPADLPSLLSDIKGEYDLEPDGLMCIPPQAEAASPHFWYLANIAADHGLKFLSMGMSADYETAIKMGATHVRIGSAFFGPRS